jgi:hypothetical protein
MLLNFDDDTVVNTTLVEEAGEIVDEIFFTPIASKTHLLTEKWEWQQLRDYVISSIEKLHGPFRRDPIKESAIFKSYITRWGDKAPAIARYAFENQKGYYCNAPISVYRFCVKSDEFFSQPITTLLGL